MKWTLNWLKDYLKTDATANEVADKLTEIGLEIESVENVMVPIVAKIVECSEIPETHLHLLKVDDGTGTRQVVCGAPNVRVGLVSALALPGTKIQGNEIKVGKIRGFESNGMMCSEKELGISDNHTGIIDLDEKKYKIGEPFFKNDDAVFDATITPNRPDYLAVRGIARDLATAGMGEFKPRATKDFGALAQGTRKVEIQNTKACPIYRMCEINGITTKPSDKIIAERLSAIGINPKNAPVDATNYICYDIGQPLHCFDADGIKGDIVVRNAKDGEKFVDLFNDEHILSANDLVITDSDGVLALAGVIGGKRGMTTDVSKNIIIEAAYFDAVCVRKTARRLGISTDASYRYERGIDPTITGDAIARASEIIMKECGGEIVGLFTAGQIPQSRSINYSTDSFKKKAGIDLSKDRQVDIINSLGFSNTKGLESNGSAEIIVPSWRPDIQISENVVSELIRIYGYHNIKIIDKKINIESTKISETKQLLAGRGLDEVSTYGFGHSHKEKLLSNGQSIKVKNPIIDTFDTLRNSLVQNMLDVIANNDRFKRSNLSLFELGSVFDGDQPGQQHDQLIIARTGILGDKIGIKHGSDVSIYDVRSDLLALFPGAMVQNDTIPEKWAHPFRAGVLVENGKTVARFAELTPAIAKKFGIKTNVVIGITDVVNDKLVDEKKIHQKKNYSLAEFPLITRDFAFIIDSKIKPTDLISTAASIDSRIIETNIFDIFDMEGGNKSVAFEIVIQPENNMKDADLLAIQEKVISEVEKLGAKIRDK